MFSSCALSMTANMYFVHISISGMNLRVLVISISKTSLARRVTKKMLTIHVQVAHRVRRKKSGLEM